VTCHDVIALRFPRQYFTIKDGGPVLGRFIERRRFRSADLIVAISDATLRDLVELGGIGSERIVRVYNGVDREMWMRGEADDHAAVARRYGLGAFLLYVGRADWRKNAEGMFGGLRWAEQNGVSL